MKTIITCAMTGSVPSRDMNPSIPCTPKEVAEDVVRVWKSGASICHVHVRDEQFKSSMDIAKFRETVKIIRGECDVVLNLTSTTELDMSFEQRIAHIVELKPEMCSFNAGSINLFPDGILKSPIGFHKILAQATEECGVKPEMEIMDSGWIQNVLTYVKQGVLKAPLVFQLVLGIYSGIPASPESLCYLKSLLPEGTNWSAFGIGKAHLPIMYTALALGGNIRVGLEDNMYYSKGKLASNNDLVMRAVRIVKEFGNEVATSDDARQILGLRGAKI